VVNTLIESIIVTSRQVLRSALANTMAHPEASSIGQCVGSLGFSPSQGTLSDGFQQDLAAELGVDLTPRRHLRAAATDESIPCGQPNLPSDAEASTSSSDDVLGMIHQAIPYPKRSRLD